VYLLTYLINYISVHHSLNKLNCSPIKTEEIRQFFTDVSSSIIIENALLSIILIKSVIEHNCK